ncbi:MAG: hypothetical protein OEW45_15580 [Deltaproteobacteria bacterium]|nr:hypothetical protein [Deltaproteobacteria bacterium]
MAFIMPTQDQFKKLMSQQYKGPTVMVNLLKFKPGGGAESYRKYYEATKELLFPNSSLPSHGIHEGKNPGNGRL